MSTTPEFRAPSRKMKVWHWYFVFAFLAGGVYGVASSLGYAWHDLPAPVILVATFAMVAAAMTCTVLWMRDIDELARQAHYVAWFWGGSFALCILLCLVLAAPALPGLIDFAALERQFAPFAGDGGGFIAGVTASLVVLSIGYGAWWLVFWLRKR